MGTTTFVWDPVSDCVLMELDETDNVKAVYTNEARQYGGVLSQRRGNTSHYHHHDALGSTRFLTDSSGNVTDTYLNDAWGNAVASTGTTVNPFRWVGKYGYYTDNSTGQVYVRARMYQPTHGEWTTIDPLGFFDGLNLYEYVFNKPTARVDPSGTRICEETCAIATSAKELSNIRSGGTVVCDTANPEGWCMCKFPLNIVDPKNQQQAVATLNPGDCNNMFHQLAEFHERAHMTLGHATCDGCEEGISLAGITKGLTAADVECALRHRDIVILKKLLASKKYIAKLEVHCIGLAETFIRFQEWWIEKNCKDITDMDKYDDWTFEELEKHRKPVLDPPSKDCPCDSRKSQ